jgi:chromosome segregation ATPase
MKSQLRDAQMTSIQMDADASQTTTTTMDNNFAVNQLEELYETISMLSRGTQTLNEDAERLNSDLLEHETKVQSLTENVSKVKVAVEEENALLEKIMGNVASLPRNLVSLTEKIDDMQYVSYNGTFTWKIPNLQEKMSK